jgi:hypothetical protein
MNTVNCRYNPNHKVKKTKLLKHEETCPNRVGSDLQRCPFNPIHLMKPDRLELHKRECPDKPKIDDEVEKEIREYINLQKKETPIIEKECKKISEDFQVIGMKKTAKKKDHNKRREQLKMLKLMEEMGKTNAQEEIIDDNKTQFSLKGASKNMFKNLVAEGIEKEFEFDGN